MPAVYLVIGLPGSGRNEVVLNLIEGGLGAEQSISIFHPHNDVPTEGTLKHAHIKLEPFSFRDGHFAFEPKADTSEENDVAFFLSDGRVSVIDQIEAFPPWLASRGLELARVILVVDCALAAAHPEVAAWHEACVHFTDCVLMNRRNALSNVWAQQFQKKFAEARFPCVFCNVKDNAVENAPLVLFPEARRMSLVFDHIDPIDELELDEENLPEEPFTLENKPDPYFERMPGGQRRKPVPDVSEFLPK